MSKFRRFKILIIILEILFIAVSNILYVNGENNMSGRLYRVEERRIISELESKPLEELDLSKYKTIVKVGLFNAQEKCDNDYMVANLSGTLYRIEYQMPRDNRPFIYMNIGLGLMLLMSIFILSYISKKVLKPFHNMSELSCELAKGNLSVPIKEEKSKFFGRFLWGMDMLRDNLETNKQKELEVQKEKKTLILSLSHDIKTPLSAIELYSKALSEKLYDTEEKQAEAIDGIIRNTKEIKKYVNEIVTASREDFLNLEVSEGEFYLSEAMSAIEVYYKDKLSVLHTELDMAEYQDCLLTGDKDRVVEVLQNIMENAVKYGDGRKISISYSDEEDCRLISIENKGCRLPKEELPHLFDSFYRGSNSQGIKGSGLGLYICKNLMKKMSGDVFAEVKDESFIVTVVIKKA